MLPIRVYKDTSITPSRSYYSWNILGNCAGGIGCHGCIFSHNTHLCVSMISNFCKTLDFTNNSYIEITVNDFPELLI